MSAPCPALGFRIRLVGAESAIREEVGRALRAVLDAEGLEVAVVTGGEWIVRREGSQTTEADRALVERWLAARPDVRSTVGPLVDLSDQ